MRIWLMCGAALAAMMATTGIAQDAPARPAPPPVVPVVENYFGTKVTDD